MRPDRKAANAMYYATHREERLAYDAAYYAAHREKRKAEAVAYRAAHPGQRTVYDNRRAALGQAYVDSLKVVPCADCFGQFPSYVKQFDHRDPSVKAFQIGGRGVTKSFAAIDAEAAKCDVVCANCHAVRTHNQRAPRNRAPERNAAEPQVTTNA